MIISHKHKFIFIKTAKTAGTSIEIALSKHCGPDDIISPISRKDEKIRKKLGYRSAQHFRKPLSEYTLNDMIWTLRKRRVKPKFRNHLPASEIKTMIPEYWWNNYYKFCFERNPYDKVISSFFWIGKKHASIKDFLLNGNGGKIRGYELYTIQDELVVDRIYKYEELEDSLIELSKTLGLNEPLDIRGIKAKGGVRKDRRDYKEVLTEEEVKLITKIYGREIELLNYQF